MTEYLGDDDIRFRLFGSHLATAHGKDFTWYRFSEMAPGPYRDVYAEHFRALRRDRLIGCGHGQVILKERQHISFIVVELPLGHPVITNLLHVYLAPILL